MKLIVLIVTAVCIGTDFWLVHGSKLSPGVAVFNSVAIVVLTAGALWPKK